MNKRSITMRALFAALILMAIAGIPGVSAYIFTSQIQDAGDTYNTVAPPSFYYPGSCSVDSTLYGSITSTSFPYTAYSYWYSPDSTNTLYSPSVQNSNISCKYLGTGTSSSSLNGFYEGKSTTISSGTASMWLKNTYTCQPGAGDIILYDNIDWRTDSYGNYPYSYGKEAYESCATTAGFVPGAIGPGYITDWLSKGTSTNCGANLNVSSYRDSSVSCSPTGVPFSYQILRMEGIPFNSGASGVVNFTLLNVTWDYSKAGTCTIGNNGNAWTALWDTVLNTTTYYGGVSPPYTFNLNLIPNRDYWILLNESHGGTVPFGSGPCVITYNQTRFNLSIWAYEPDLSCTNWTTCSQSSQQRTCTDLNGKITPYVETRSCSALSSVVFLANLGFEASVEKKASICQVGSACGIIPYNISVQYPLNWTVSSNLDGNGVYYENFITMTSEGGSREGTRALKLWYIPPSMYEPIDDAGTTECGNATTGRAPEVDTPYNSTLFVAANVSFPAEFMDLRYSVKKCASVPLRWDAVPWYCALTPSKSCYGVCNSTLKGTYGVRLVDASDSSMIVDIYGEAADTWGDYVADLSGHGLKTAHNYTLAIAVNPFNLQDPYSSCVYVDKVQATIRDDGLVSCTSFCDENLTRYEVISTDTCLYRAAPSSLCVSDAAKATELEEVIAGTRNYTCQGNDAYSYDKATGRLIVTPNAPLCITENAQKEATTPSTIDEYLAATVYNVVFWASLLTLIACFGLILAVAWMGSDVGQLIILPLFGIAQFIFVLSVYGVLPIYFAIMIGVIAAALIAFFISKTVR